MADETATQTPSWTVVGSENEWMVVHPTQDPIGPLRRREAAEVIRVVLVVDALQPNRKEDQ